MIDYKNIYFIGIGGAGMSALASYFLFHKSTCKVMGYDRVSSDNTLRLSKLGAKIGFDIAIEIERIKAFNSLETLVVYTPAISSENLIYSYFKKNKFILFKRAQLLGEISKNYYTIAVAGTHGKTTVTAMLSVILKNINIDFMTFVGGVVINLKSNFYSSKNTPKVMVVEADEFDRSFLNLYPDLAILTSVDPDHLDIYQNVSNIKKAFVSFVSQIKKNGTLITTKQVLNNLKLPEAINTITYGSDDKSLDFNILNYNNRKESDNLLICNKGNTESFTLNFSGRHNAENMLAAIATANSYKTIFSSSKLKAAVLDYKGVKRRFECYIDADKVYIDDYAHHPKEIKTVITSVKEIYPKGSLTVIFQPHLYTRTKDFHLEFAASLSLSDTVILLPIYPAREKAIEGVNSSMIYNKIVNTNKYLFSKASCIDYLSQKKDDIEILLSLGAGDIGLLTNEFKSCLVE